MLYTIQKQELPLLPCFYKNWYSKSYVELKSGVLIGSALYMYDSCKQE